MSEPPAREVAGGDVPGIVPANGPAGLPEPPGPVDAPEAAPERPGRGSAPASRTPRPSPRPLPPTEPPGAGGPTLHDTIDAGGPTLHDTIDAAVQPHADDADVPEPAPVVLPALDPDPGQPAAGSTGSSPVPASTPTPPPTPVPPRDADHTEDRGTTTVNDGVVAKVVSAAVRAVPGVHALGSPTARALGQIREAVGQSDHGQGITVEVGERQVAVDVTLVAAYPWPLQDLAHDVRAAVYDAVETLVGKDVTEVNVTITDIDIPESGRPSNRHPEPKERRVT